LALRLQPGGPTQTPQGSRCLWLTLTLCIARIAMRSMQRRAACRGSSQRKQNAADSCRRHLMKDTHRDLCSPQETRRREVAHALHVDAGQRYAVVLCVGCGGRQGRVPQRWQKLNGTPPGREWVRTQMTAITCENKIETHAAKHIMLGGCALVWV